MRLHFSAKNSTTVSDFDDEPPNSDDTTNYIKSEIIVCPTLQDADHSATIDSHSECNASASVHRTRDKTLHNNSDERITLLKSIAEKPQKIKTSLDLFFESMCETVKSFPAWKQVEVKISIAQLVGKAELDVLQMDPLH